MLINIIGNSTEYFKLFHIIQKVLNNFLNRQVNRYLHRLFSILPGFTLVGLRQASAQDLDADTSLSLANPPTYSNRGTLTGDRRGAWYKKRFDSWGKRREDLGPWCSCHKEPGRKKTCQNATSPGLNSGEWQPVCISFPLHLLYETLSTQTNLHWWGMRRTRSCGLRRPRRSSWVNSQQVPRPGATVQRQRVATPSGEGAEASQHSVGGNYSQLWGQREEEEDICRFWSRGKVLSWGPGDWVTNGHHYRPAGGRCKSGWKAVFTITMTERW